MNFFFKRPGVHADSNGRPGFLRRFGHLKNRLLAADIARIDTQLRHTDIGDDQRDAVIKMDVGDDRHLDLGYHLLERSNTVATRGADSHNVAAGILEAQEGHHPKAIALFEEMLALRPRASAMAEANYRLAEIYVSIGKRERAVGHLVTAVAQAPGDLWGKKSEEYLKLLR